MLPSLLLALQLGAQPANPSTVPEEPMKGFVKAGESLVPAKLLCEQGDEIVFLAGGPDRLEALPRKEGAAGPRTLPLKALPSAAPEWDCGLGTCYFTQRLESAEGKADVELQGHRSLYHGSWAPAAVLHETGAAPSWKAICPGERPLLICMTARRTVQVTVSGDPNDVPVHFDVDYVATPPGKETKDTLHLSHGKVRRAGGQYVATFSNKGFLYRVTAGAGDAGAATLTVERGGKAIQTEPCLAYGLWTAHLDWAANRR